MCDGAWGACYWAMGARLMLWAIPFYFFFAVLSRTYQQWKGARNGREPPSVPTEPLVLMVLGMMFLSANAEFITVSASVLMNHVRTVSPMTRLPWIEGAAAFSAVVLIVSFSKAFWTHLNLEEGKWGPIENYRNGIWRQRALSPVEFLLRVGIAMAVVLLQKNIAGISSIPGVEHAVGWDFADEGASALFEVGYKRWLGQTTFVASVFFTLIIVWLVLVSCFNRNNKEFTMAFWGTAFFAVPGLVVSCALRYIATGSVYGESIASPTLDLTLLLIGVVSVFSLIIISNLLVTMWSARHAFRFSSAAPGEGEAR